MSSDSNKSNKFMRAKIQASIDSRKALEPLIEKSTSLEYTEAIISQQGQFMMNLVDELRRFLNSRIMKVCFECGPCRIHFGSVQTFEVLFEH